MLNWGWIQKCDIFLKLVLIRYCIFPIASLLFFLPDLSLSRSYLIPLNQEQTSLRIDIVRLCPVNTNLGSKILTMALIKVCQFTRAVRAWILLRLRENSKNKIFPYIFFLHIISPCSSISYFNNWVLSLWYITSGFLLFNFQPSSRPEPTIFHVHNYRLDCQTRLSDPRAQIRPLQQPGDPSRNQTTTSKFHSKPTDPAGPAPDQTRQIRPAPPPHQIRSPHRPQATILNYSASNRHSTPNLLKWCRSGAFFMGWVKGGI